MSNFDADYYASIIENNGEPGVSYPNESLRGRDVEDAYHELDCHGYELDVWGNAVPK